MTMTPEPLSMQEVRRREPCRICSTLRSEHGGKNHAFVGEGDTNTSLRPASSSDRPPSGDAPASQGSLGIALKGDPVLRIALIRAGVITVDQINQAEEELKVVGLGAVAPKGLG